jgi:hypothetical protein
MSTRFVFRAAGLICALFFIGAPASAQSVADKALAFQQRVDEAARMMDSSPRLRDLSHERRRGIVQFVAGNMLFTLLHEMGHAHITEMGLPVLGREEDAADSFAVVTMLKVGSSFSHDVLVQAAMGWFLNALRDEKEGVKLSFYDTHGLDRQRAFQIVCLMVGSDPDKFKDLAGRTPVVLPGRLQQCVMVLGDRDEAASARADASKDQDRDCLWQGRGRFERLRGIVSHASLAGNGCRSGLGGIRLAASIHARNADLRQVKRAMGSRHAQAHALLRNGRRVRAALSPVWRAGCAAAVLQVMRGRADDIFKGAQ